MELRVEEDKSTEILSAKSYFLCRTGAFWFCFLVCTVAGSTVAVTHLMWPETFISFYAAGALEVSEATLLIQTRGLILLLLITSGLVGFLRRSRWVRYACCLSACFVTLNFAFDLVVMVMSEDWYYLLATSKVFFIRPFVICGLIVVSLSLSQTIRLERHVLPPNTVQVETVTSSRAQVSP